MWIVVLHFIGEKKMVPRDVEWLAYGYSASQGQCQDKNLDFLTPDFQPAEWKYIC
jgi:hypothetical protein